ncbi:hypothetical protein FS749_015282 [Ceratobasidium sp. UAMH 11750]|nr:hypothetical protein FS749_015282 [Ceratobasidium sp. UAMH 11750]
MPTTLAATCFAIEELRLRGERERVAKLRADNSEWLNLLIKQEASHTHAATIEDELAGRLSPRRENGSNATWRDAPPRCSASRCSVPKGRRQSAPLRPSSLGKEEVARLRAAQAEELAEAARLERPAFPHSRPRTVPRAHFGSLVDRDDHDRGLGRAPGAHAPQCKSPSHPPEISPKKEQVAPSRLRQVTRRHLPLRPRAVVRTHEDEHSPNPPVGPPPPAPLPAGFRTYGPLNPMHGGNSDISPPPPLTDSAAGAIGPAPGQSHPPRPDSRGPDGLPGPVRELPALAISAPNACPGSPPFRAPPPLQLDERSGRGSSNQLAPMDRAMTAH